jgi:hypothetical protein
MTTRAASHRKLRRFAAILALALSAAGCGEGESGRAPVDGDSHLHGRAVGEPLRAIDLALADDAISIEPAQRLTTPELLLRSGVARRVLWKQELYWLEGGMLASRAHPDANLPGAWRVEVSGTRHATAAQSIERVSVLDPSGREQGFLEFSDDAGTSRDMGAPGSTAEALGVEQRDLTMPQPLPHQTKVDDAVPLLPLAWSDETVGPLPAGVASATGCATPPPVELLREAHGYRIAVGALSLHPGTRAELLCPGDEVWVIQALAAFDRPASPSHVLNRFDRATGAWLGGNRVQPVRGVPVGAAERADGRIELVWRDRTGARETWRMATIDRSDLFVAPR